MTYTYSNGKIKIAVITTANSHHVFHVTYSCLTVSRQDLVKGECDIIEPIVYHNAHDLAFAPSLYQEYLRRVVPRDSFYFWPGDERK